MDTVKFTTFEEKSKHIQIFARNSIKRFFSIPL